MADKYTLMQGPNGEALVYSTDTGTVMPLPGTDPAAGGPGAPMRFLEAQAKWQDLLPQIPQLLQSSSSTGMQPGVVPAGYNPAPPPAAMPPSGPPRQSSDGRYTEVDTPDGRMIQDTQSGVRYSANMAPQEVLNSLYGPAAPASSRPADAATPVGQVAPPIVNGVVKTNVYGNPTAGERANGITTTQYPLPATPGVGPNPVPAAVGGPAVGAGAGFTIPRMTMPTSVDYTTPGSIFASYAGVNRPSQATPVAPAPPPTQSTGTQFAPLSIPAQPQQVQMPPPQVSMKPAPLSAAPAPAAPSPTISVNGQQVATLQPSAITGSPAYLQQQAANNADLQASNARGQALAATRQYGYGDVGEEGGGGRGFYLPSQLASNQPGPQAPAAPLTPPPGVNPGLFQALTGTYQGPSGAAPNVAGPGQQGSQGGTQQQGTQFSVMSAYGGGTPVGGGASPVAPSDPWQNPNNSPAGGMNPPAQPPVPVQNPPNSGPPNNPPPAAPTQTGGGGGGGAGQGVPAGMVTVPTQTMTQARNPYTGEPIFNPDGTPQMVASQSQTYQAQPGYMNPDQLNQLIASTGLTQAQQAQMMALLPGQIDIQHATVAQIQAAISNAAAQLGLQIDAQKFNQGLQTAQLALQQGIAVGQVGDQATLGRTQTMGFDQYGNPTLAAQAQQVQNALGYAASNRADIGVQQANTAMMGYDANGNPTLQGQQTVSSEDRANLLAQASIGNQAAQIALSQLAQQEGQREFDANNALARQEADRQWRQNPASFLDQAWSQRGAAAPTTQAAGGFAAPSMAQAASGTQYSTMSAPAPAGSVAAPQGQAGYTPATQQGPLTYADIQRSGVEPPGVAAATGGFQQMPQYQTAGGMPRISQQAYGQLNPTEQQAFGAELQATGNNPADYFKQQQMLTQPAVRSSGGFSAPRPQVAGSL